jgi:hypothetical protein
MGDNRQRIFRLRSAATDARRWEHIRIGRRKIFRNSCAGPATEYPRPRDTRRGSPVVCSTARTAENRPNIAMTLMSLFSSCRGNIPSSSTAVPSPCGPAGNMSSPGECCTAEDPFRAHGSSTRSAEGGPSGKILRPHSGQSHGRRSGLTAGGIPRHPLRGIERPLSISAERPAGAKRAAPFRFFE